MIKTINHFPLSYRVLVLYILLKTYLITILPLRDTLKSFEFYSDIIILFLFFILILDYNNFNDSLSFFSNKFSLMIVFILFIFLYSSFFVNLDYNMKLRTLLKLIAILMIFYSFFIKFAKFLYRDEMLFDKFINYIIIISVTLSLLGVFVNSLGINSNPLLSQSYRGIFMHPNTFAFLFTFGIPGVFYKYFSNKISFIKFTVILIVFLSVLFLTYSRAGFLAGLVCMYVFIFFKSRFFSFVLVILFLLIFSTFFSEIQGLKSDSTVARGILFITAFNLITENSINMYWGYGVDRAIELFTDTKMLFGNFEMAVNNPHNFLLLLSLQFGVIFAISYLLMIVFLLVKSMFRVKLLESGNLKWKVVTCISIVSGLLLQNFFEELMVIPEFPVMPLSLIFMGYLFYFISDKSINKIKVSESLIHV